MSKYRLSYLGYGGLKSIDLKKLDCLIGYKVTDIDVIDKFTTSFNNLEELLMFLKRNNLITDDVNKLYITIDKKVDNNIINKKIYNGEKLLFKNDIELLKISFIYKWILSNKNNNNYIIAIANNYMDKYKNAYNRIDGSSYILSLFSTLKNIAINKNNYNIENGEINEFNKCISDFIDIEFYKLDKFKWTNYKIIEKKKDKNGNYLKNYRNIHDFVILIKELDKSLNKINSKNNKSLIVYNNIEEETNLDNEEFLTYDDYINTNEGINRVEEFEPYIDGNDFIAPITLEEIKESLNNYDKRVLKKN